jgi:hypothetical protein
MNLDLMTNTRKTKNQMIMGMKDQIVLTEVKGNLNRTSSTHHNKKKVMIAKNLAKTVVAGVIILKTCTNLKPNKMMMHQIKVKKSLMTMQVKAGLRKVMKKRSITE